MCLNKLLPLQEKPPKYGWKVFVRVGLNRLLPQYGYGIPGHPEGHYRENVWYHSNKRSLRRQGNGTLYVPNFHVFASRRAAEKLAGNSSSLTIRKIEMQGVQHKGLQRIWSGTWWNSPGDYVCYIARKIKILSVEASCG